MTLIRKRLPGGRGISASGRVLCLLAGMLASSVVPGTGEGAAGRVTHSFIHTQTRYTFESGFDSRADLECLLHVFFDYDHFKRLMTHVQDIHLDRKGDGWYEVTYTYRNFFYEAVSTFRRTLDLKRRLVRDDLLRVRQKGVVAPAIHAIHGYYRMMPRGGGFRVIFRQEGEIEASLLGGFYFGFAEREAAAFMERVMIYAGEVCSGAPAGHGSPQKGDAHGKPIPKGLWIP